MITVTSLKFVPLTKKEIAELPIRFVDDRNDEKSDSDVRTPISHKIVLQCTADSARACQHLQTKLCEISLSIKTQEKSTPNISIVDALGYSLEGGWDVDDLSIANLPFKKEWRLTVSMLFTVNNRACLINLVVNENEFNCPESICGRLLTADPREPASFQVTSILHAFVGNASQFFQSLKRTVNQATDSSPSSPLLGSQASNNTPSNSSPH